MSSSRDAPTTTTTGGAAPVYVSALPSRSTRGKRMSALLEDEDSADEAFWGQDAFAEESGDDEYESESEEVDVVDDDFHDDESSESEGEVYVARERTSKALKAPERKKPATTTAAAGGGAADRRRGMAAVAATGVSAGMSGGAVVNDGAAAGMGAMGTDVVGEYEPRKTKRSTAQAILQKSEQMRAERAAKPAPERQKVEYRQLTQEELLEEAKETEYWNLLDLERLLTLEAEMKKKPSTDKKKYEGPSIVHKSSIKVNGGVTVVELAHGAETPTPLRQAAPTPPKPNVCVITGQPAKYKDPLTGMPYATIEAFKEVRKRYPPIEKKPDLVEEPTAAAAAAATTTTQAPQPIIEVKIEPPVVQPTVKGLRGKRRGKPSASKLSTLPFKTLKEEPVVADEVMTDAI
jgi:vacuolar protein sorting-associated protein 72